MAKLQKFRCQEREEKLSERSSIWWNQYCDIARGTVPDTVHPRVNAKKITELHANYEIKYRRNLLRYV